MAYVLVLLQISLAFQHEFTSASTMKYMPVNMYISTFNIQDSNQ